MINRMSGGIKYYGKNEREEDRHGGMGKNAISVEWFRNALVWMCYLRSELMEIKEQVMRLFKG
jgi:hypothetical protein